MKQCVPGLSISIPRWPFHRPSRGRISQRSGVIIVWFGVLLVVLIGMLGLVIDCGLIMAAHRRTQNAADAGAMAAAMERMRGATINTAKATVLTFVTTHNALTLDDPDNDLTVSIPPMSGPYTGDYRFVEVVVDAPYKTFFIHILGISSDQSVSARAVAGYEAVSAGEGVMVLDPYITPGLSLQGTNAKLIVNGRIVVNSGGKGYDEDGVLWPAESESGNGFGATTGNSTAYHAKIFDIYGAVDTPDNYKPYNEGDPNPLHAKAGLEPDPLIHLPTPISGAMTNPDAGANGNDHILQSGVDSTRRGDVAVPASGDPSGIPNPPEGITYGLTDGVNFVVPYEADGTTPITPIPAYDGYYLNSGDVVLYPGVYDQLTIQGGNVYMVPGIYVISPRGNVTLGVNITGGNVFAKGIMFYNTATSYTPQNGLPDANDYLQGDTVKNLIVKNNNDGLFLGGVQLNESMDFTPIKTDNYPSGYASLYDTGVPDDNAGHVSPAFDGMLFYQRRRIGQSFSVAGGEGDGKLSGTLYAKWAQVQITGNGTYDAQFVVGSMAISGQGTIVLRGAGDDFGKANQIFLVE